MEEFRTEEGREAFARLSAAFARTPKLRPAPATTKVSPRRFVEHTWQRMESYHVKKKTWALQRQRKARRREAAHSFKPSINLERQRLVGSRKPLYERLDKVIEERQEEMAALHDRIKKFAEPSVTPEPRTPKRRRSFAELYTSLNKWEQHRNKKAQELRESLEEEEVKELIFQPVINSTSQKLMKDGPPVSIRFAHDLRKRQAQARDNSTRRRHSFSPTITARAKALQPAVNVFQRLSTPRRLQPSPATRQAPGVAPDLLEELLKSVI